MSSDIESGESSTIESRPASDSDTWVIDSGDTDPSSKNRPRRPRSASMACRSRGKITGHDWAS